jgi:hypothetical protein
VDDNDPLFVKPDENSGVRWFSLEGAIAASTEPWFQEHIYSKLNAKLARFLKGDEAMKHEDELIAILKKNPTVWTMLEKAPSFGLKHYYIWGQGRFPKPFGMLKNQDPTPWDLRCRFRLFRF